MSSSASKTIVAFAAESACSNSTSASCNENCKVGGSPKTAARVESWRWSIGWSDLIKGPMSLWNLRILSFWLSELAPMEDALTEEREDDAAAAATADALRARLTAWSRSPLASAASKSASTCLRAAAARTAWASGAERRPLRSALERSGIGPERNGRADSALGAESGIAERSAERSGAESHVRFRSGAESGIRRAEWDTLIPLWSGIGGLGAE